MTTPNPDLAALAQQALNGGPVPAGLPDTAELSRLANLYFSATPTSDATAVDNVPPSAAAAAPSFHSVPAGFNRRPGIDDAFVPTAPSAAAFGDHYSDAIDNVPHSAATLAPAANVASGFDRLPGIDQNALSGLVSRSFGLPGEAELKQALAVKPGNLVGSKPPAVASTFYFLNDVSALARSAQIPSLGSAHPAFDVHAVRKDFPILAERVNGYPLAWLDNAATTQKPQCVIDRISEFYRHENSNIHRAAHELAARATDAYEGARDTVARFINASSADDIVFVRGSTEAINLVAQSWGRQFIGQGDEIVISWLEHHANIVPWQQLCQETGAVLRVIPVDDDGQVILAEYQKLLNAKTKLVSFTQVSNALGTVTPAAEMIELAHRAGAKVLLDGAQSVSHLRVDVQSLDCDWFVFSGHKIFGPTGIGVLYGKPELLAATQPWQGGGNMIEDVTFEKTVYQPAPAKFEAGTGNIADAVGLGAALDYLSRIGIENVARYEHELLEYGMHALRMIPGLRLIGTAPDKTSVLSFVLAGHSTQDVGKALNEAGIAVRSGHHCAQPILRRFGLEATVRSSLAFYNTYEEIDRLAAVVKRLQCSKTHFSG
ncbi:family 2A encapsulin nanocompartment cargo protein cysteine desulfurase [Methylomonas sp. EFPC3]|uniref:family 2A encapsulin nanocompartment cargo protein cysteine desulfurase n=1 Tax=Methylomonas sp. EFPC3 TaxID=3021710 RepID=UPI002415E15C|nr:family 2A encapsulin nanocompartment cargo protein cysteine desulfurase [Methylomonas sp. EFPC3]WFP51111.1 family 2A encapsulin nanocompartment cargo protein cysteine desulfurase [Methylomonas sp. EFPC3]